jgi:hypothetical protein
MTDTAVPGQAPRPPLTVDLDAVERTMSAASGSDLTEAKEAIVEALVQLGVRRCTGEGRDGEFIFNSKPAAKLVSGFLLPRFDPTGQDDETSDIHIATMGMDFQVAAQQSGDIAIVPHFSIYVRVLPSWEELSDPRYDMMPRSEVSRDIRQIAEDRARQYINEARAALPQLDDPDEPDERPADAAADAQRARDAADQAEQRLEEGGADAETRGASEAAQASARRAEEIARARSQAVQRRLAARRERNAALTAIRQDAFTRAFAELGIQLRDARPGAAGPMRPLRADGSGEPGAAPAPDTDDVAAGIQIVVRSDAGVLDDALAERQPIPMKWRRFHFDLGEYRLDCHDPAAREAAAVAFATRVVQQTQGVLTEWLATDEGQRDAYRPNERILPSHFASKASW